MNDEQLAKALREIGGLCEEHDSIVDQLAAVTADRDIKAANLQLLVEKVLDFDAREQGDIDAIAFMDSVEKDWVEIVELARGLKQ